MNPSAREGPSEEGFDQALERFRNFLAREGFSPNVIWIEPSDVVLTVDKRIFVCHTGGESAAVAARDTFEQGVQKGNGVVLKGLFPKKDATYSFVWFPQDSAEAEYEMLPQGVKLQVNLSEIFKVIIIRSKDRWQALSQRHGSMQFMKTDLFR